MRFYSTILFLLILPITATGQVWKSYYDSATNHWGQNWNQSIYYLEKSKEIALMDLGIYDPNYIAISSQLGIALWNNRETDKAIFTLNDALSTSKEILTNDNAITQQIIVNLAMIYDAQGKDSLSNELYNLVKYDRENKAAYWKSLNALLPTLDYSIADEYASWLNQKIEAIPQPLSDLDNFEIALLKSRISNLIGNTQEAYEELKKLRNLQKMAFLTSELRLFARYYHALGVAAEATGKLSEAELSYKKSLRLADPNNPIYQQSLIALAQLYQTMGNVAESIDSYNLALERCEGLGTSNCYSIRNNIAALWLENRKFELAEKQFDLILTDKTISENDPVFYSAMAGHGLCLLELNKLAEARILFTELQEALKKKEDLAGVIQTEHNLGLIALLSGDFLRAYELLNNARDAKEETYGQNSLELKNTVIQLALAAWELGKKEECFMYMQETLNIIQHEIDYVFPSLTLTAQASYQDRLKEEFEKFYSILLSEGSVKPELLKKLYQHQIQLKGLLFNYEKQRATLVAELNDSYLNSLYDELTSTRREIAAYYKNSLLVDEELESELEERADNLEKQLTARLPLQRKKDFVRWENLQRSLSVEEAFINIVQFRKFESTTKENIKGDSKTRFGFTDSTFYAALITTKETVNAPELVLLSHGEYLETRARTYLRNATEFDVLDNHSYRYFWKEIDDKLMGKTTVYISNDGIYHSLNVAAFYDHSTDKYMLDKYDIFYTLGAGKKPEKTGLENYIADVQQITLLGNPNFENIPDVQNLSFNPLPETREEIYAIESKFKDRGWNTILFEEDLANRTNLEQNINSRIIHIATHGFYNEDEFFSNSPYKSLSAGLALAQHMSNEDVDDLSSIYTAYEVSNLLLNNTSLVTLSACETGVGKIENGEGVYSLQRAFAAAGAENIVNSLWKVDDKMCRIFMDHFYAQITEGQTFQDALVASQRHIKRLSPNTRDWAAFVLVNS